MSQTPNIQKIPVFLTARIISALLLGAELILWLAFIGYQHVEHRVGNDTLMFFWWIAAQFIVTFFFFYRKPWAALALGAMNIPLILLLGWGMWEAIMYAVPPTFFFAGIVFGLMIFYMVTLWQCFSSSRSSPAPVLGFEPIMKEKKEGESGADASSAKGG